MTARTNQNEREGAATPPFLAIELRNVSKSFGAVQANRDINLKVEAGSIHGIVGENGAGKSTLMNILYGLHTADSGDILINGESVAIRSSADAIRHGIGMVHQHFMLVPNFSVLENVMLGSEGGMSLKQGKAETLKSLASLADEYGMKVDPHALIEDLPVGTRQRVEIIKAMRGGAKILILDEPTGVLTPQEADSLFEILRVLKSRGVTVLLITHKLGEIMAITDAVSIIRDGTVVGHRKTTETSTGELAELMVGREVLLTVDRGTSAPAQTRLSVNNLDCTASDGTRLLKNVSLEIRSGEILGVAGVAGNGQTELLEVLSGMRKPGSGTIDILGNRHDPAHAKTPAEMRKLGLGHIPEDRHHHGLVLDFEASENMVFGFHHTALSGAGALLDTGKMTAHCSTQMQNYDIRPRNPALNARNFSGGNQQKIVIAREMYAEPGVLIVGQPTRGVDIGAIEFIHKQLIELRDRGCAILLVSVELDEILGLSDRIMVMNEGRVVGIVDREKASERTLGLMMAGLSASEAA